MKKVKIVDDLCSSQGERIFSSFLGIILLTLRSGSLIIYVKRIFFEEENLYSLLYNKS